GYLLECLQHLVFSLCACKRCQTHNGSLSVTELGCSLFRFHLKIQSFSFRFNSQEPPLAFPDCSVGQTSPGCDHHRWAVSQTLPRAAKGGRISATGAGNRVPFTSTKQVARCHIKFS
ncbi:unnamed protein product, partial [Gulo gulo]